MRGDRSWNRGLFHPQPATGHSARPRLGCAGNRICLAFGCLLQTGHRSDCAHLLQGLGPCYVLLGYLLAACGEEFAQLAHRSIGPYKSGRWSRRFGRALLAGVPPTAAVLGIAATVWAGFALNLLFTPSFHVWRYFSDYYFQTTAGFVDQVRAETPQNPYVRMIDYLRLHCPPGQMILAVPYSTSLYVFAGRPFAGGQAFVLPGFFTSPTGLQRLVDTLRNQGKPPVVEIANFAFDRSPWSFVSHVRARALGIPPIRVRRGH